MKTLRFGDRGDEVRRLQSLLASQGYFTGGIRGNFLDHTLEAVIYFQQTHLGPNGKPLEVDGIVGPQTWWALYHPSGEYQRENIPSLQPNVDSEDRRALLQWADMEHAAGVREVPDGSNDGPRISEYLKSVEINFPAPWCAAFVCCGFTEVMGEGKWLIDDSGAVQVLWNRGVTAGISLRRGTYFPRPGDLFVMLHGNGRGHTGFVYRTSHDGSMVNTLEGNVGNRVKRGVRSVRTFYGFINLLKDQDRQISAETGLIGGDDVSKDTDR